MRVIGGKLSGRRFGAPRGKGTRPTGERVREALASALQSRDAFDGAVVLDLFAGSGALGFEALSRGASMAVLVDADPRTVREIKSNARELGVDDATQVVRLDLFGDPNGVTRKLSSIADRFDLVFVDAPYARIASVPPLLEALVTRAMLSEGAWIAVEHPVSHPWVWPNGLAPDADYRYGQTGISLGVHASQKGSP